MIQELSACKIQAESNEEDILTLTQVLRASYRAVQLFCKQNIRKSNIYSFPFHLSLIKGNWCEDTTNVLFDIAQKTSPQKLNSCLTPLG